MVLQFSFATDFVRIFCKLPHKIGKNPWQFSQFADGCPTCSESGVLIGRKLIELPKCRILKRKFAKPLAFFPDI
jgi:hypothetical protein